LYVQARNKAIYQKKQKLLEHGVIQFLSQLPLSMDFLEEAVLRSQNYKFPATVLMV
jgi:hypothetical protein